MKKGRPPAVVIRETPNLKVLARPRARKLYGHEMIDYTIDLRRHDKVDGRKIPHPHGMGPGYCVAKLNFGGQLKVWDDFKAILKGCPYRELTALARALDVSYNTVLNWQKGRFNPSRPTTVLEIIEWARNGKPMDKMTQTWHGAEPVFFPDSVERLKAHVERLKARKESTYNPFDEVAPNPWDDDGEDDGKSFLNPWDRPPNFDSPFP